MSVLLLVLATICWLIAGVPGFIQVGVGRVEWGWGWLGLFFLGIWLLIGGAGQLLAIVRRAP